MGAHLELRLEQTPELGLVPVGFVDQLPVAPAELARRDRPVLGTLEDVPALLSAQAVTHVLIAFQLAPDRDLRPLVHLCYAHDVEVSIVPRLFDDTTNRIVLEHVGGVPVFALRQVDPRGWQFQIKHACDRAIAALLLVALAPAFAILALAVRRSSRGPILFRQRRVGRDGREFDLLKFRSMRPGPTAAVVTPRGLGPGGVEGADRRTRVGLLMRCFSLDELPQLVNVLRGQMSLVGPRPERPEFVRRFDHDLDRYDERHRVRAGITGWAQVHGLRGRTSLADRVEWDNYYIQNWSLWLDAKILLLTLPALLRRAE